MSTTATAAEQTTLEQLVALDAEKKDTEKRLRALKEQIGPLHERMLEEFAEAGVQSMKHAASGRLVYIQRQTWAKAEDKDAAYEALIAAGLADYAVRGFSAQSLSAYFREELKRRTEAGEIVEDPNVLIPEPLRGVVTLDETTAIRVRS